MDFEAERRRLVQRIEAIDRRLSLAAAYDQPPDEDLRQERARLAADLDALLDQQERLAPYQR